jgi:hypothetical protein
MWRLLYLPAWLTAYYALVWLPLYAMGWALIPMASALGAYAKDSQGHYQFTWKIMEIYNNDSDGITCEDKNPDGSYVFWPEQTSLYSRIWRWSAMRNPLAKITMIPWIHCAINPSEVRFKGSSSTFTSYELNSTPCWYVAWDGLFVCFYLQFKSNNSLKLLWIGAKIKPTDVNGVEAYRTPRTYITVQYN